MGFAVFLLCAYCILCVFCVLLMFLQYYDTAGWVFWPVKTVSHITYVLSGTLNHAQSINQSINQPVSLLLTTRSFSSITGRLFHTVGYCWRRIHVSPESPLRTNCGQMRWYVNSYQRLLLCLQKLQCYHLRVNSQPDGRLYDLFAYFIIFAYK